MVYMEIILILGLSKEVIKIEQIENQDKEWANDWNSIVEIFGTIERLKDLFNSLDVSYLRKIEQKVLLLNLEKYAWSLQNYIVEKYSKE